MPKFDYKIAILAYDVAKVQDSLNDLGNEGWELIAVDFEARRYIFKKIRYHEDNNTKN
jgi:hypothetical protein